MSPIIHDDADPVIIASSDILPLENGGTESDLSATGPGLLKQASAGAPVTVHSVGQGEIVYGSTVSGLTSLPSNNSATRKFLSERYFVVGVPLPGWVDFDAGDVKTGQLGLARGGTHSDLSATGPGLLYQAAAGANVTVTWRPTLEELIIYIAGSESALTLKADANHNDQINFQNSAGTNGWALVHDIGGGGAQGAFRLYNSGLGTDAISVDTSNNVTLVGLTAARSKTASPRNMHTLASPAKTSGDGTDATPVATEFYFAEIEVGVNVNVTGIAIFNGSVASGNVKVGLFFPDGVLAATSASTAMSGTDAYQLVPFTGVYAAKGPATYYVGLFIDNATARFNTHIVGTGGTSKKTAQAFATGFTAITPPTTFITALGPIASLY